MQAQTLRFFRLLRLLGPPQSSKPQRLLAATEPEATLATDSVLGARHHNIRSLCPIHAVQSFELCLSESVSAIAVRATGVPAIGGNSNQVAISCRELQAFAR